MKLKRNVLLLFLCAICAFASFGQSMQPVEWQVNFEETGSDSGILEFKAVIKDGWYLYDTKSAEGGPAPTSVSLNLENAELVNGLVPSRPAVEKTDFFFHLLLGRWEHEVTFTQAVRLLEPSGFRIEGSIQGQVSNGDNCLRTKKEFSFFREKEEPAEVVAVDEIVPEIPQNKPQYEERTSDYWKPVEMPESDNAPRHSLLYIFVSGLIGGLIVLLTPAIWPMIPITVGVFWKESSRRRKALLYALIYGLSTLVIYLCLGVIFMWVFGVGHFNNISTSGLFNLFFFAMLMIFAMSFFGLFDINLPSKWTAKVDSKASNSSGLLSIFFTAFALALVSFSCTAPIIGTLLVELSIRDDVYGPIVGILGFATALVIPFTLFAVFPSWMKRLPKPGSWLNSVMVVLGFIEMALSLKYLAAADRAYGWGIVDREMFVSLWFAVFFVLGFYLLNMVKISGSNRTKAVGPFRLILAVVSIAFSAYLLTGLWGAPLKLINGIVPPMSTQDFKLGDSTQFLYYQNFEDGVDAAKESGRPVLLSFASSENKDCVDMEQSVLKNDKVRDLIGEHFVFIRLKTDDATALPKPMRLKKEKQTIRTYGELWLYLQKHKFGASSQPYYVVLDNEGGLLSGPLGFDKDISRFSLFLQTSIDNYNKKNE